MLESEAPVIPDDWMEPKYKELEYRIKLKLDLMDSMEVAAEEAVEVAKQKLKDIREARGRK